MINIWLFGDSFSTEGHLAKGLRKLLKNKSVMNENANFYTDSSYTILDKTYTIRNYSGGSMDMQTIIDFWTKNLPKIKENDIVIVNLTEYGRHRLSLKKEYIYTSPHHPHNSEYEKKSYFNYISNGWLTKNGMIESVMDLNLSEEKFTSFVDIASYDKMQDSVLLNYFEIIESLYTLTKANKKFVWSWNDEYIADFIYNKKRIINEILGYWETQHQLYIKTFGKSGIENDAHLSDECNEKLSEYLYKKFIDGNI